MAKKTADRIDQFLAIARGETGLRPVNVRLILPDGKYYGKLVIAEDEKPKTEVIELQGDNCLTFVHMDIRPIDGGKTSKSVRCTFNTTFEEVLEHPEQWQDEFHLSSRKVQSGAGNWYSQVNISEKVGEEV